MDVRELIRSLGGPTKVAEDCGVTPQAVTNWMARGRVAAEHQVTLWRLATERGVAWTPPGAEGLKLESAAA